MALRRLHRRAFLLCCVVGGEGALAGYAMRIFLASIKLLIFAWFDTRQHEKSSILYGFSIGISQNHRKS